MSWGDLFERADGHEVTVEAVRTALSNRRAEGPERDEDGEDGGERADSYGDESEPGASRD